MGIVSYSIIAALVSFLLGMLTGYLIVRSITKHT